MWKWIKVPKGIALLAFLLPWMTVSCQTTPLAKATGIGLALGHVESLGQQTANTGSAQANIWLIAALIVIVAGIVVNFVLDRKGAAVALGTSVIALALIWIGTMRYSKEAIMAQASKSGAGGPGTGTGPDAEMARAALNMIQIDWQFGFYLCVVALVAAAVMAGLVVAGKDAQVMGRLNDLVPNKAADAGGAEPM